MTDLKQKVAIVTGASRGIGAAIAERLAADGFAVVINYTTSAPEAEALATKIVELGGKAIAVKADISNPGAASALFELAEDAFGKVDVLVNNAGIMKLSGLSETDDTMIDRQIDINLKGSIYTMREAANRLQDGGRIINLSTSVVGLKPETYGIYAATKAAIETLTAILAKEMRGRNVTVNAVAPGPTATSLFLEGKSDELIEKMSKMSPLERLATPEDIAASVSFLAGPDGGWINGQVLRANGGMV